jgi:hypothetical protein
MNHSPFNFRESGMRMLRLSNQQKDDHLIKQGFTMFGIPQKSIISSWALYDPYGRPFK